MTVMKRGGVLGASLAVAAAAAAIGLTVWPSAQGSLSAAARTASARTAAHKAPSPSAVRAAGRTTTNPGRSFHPSIRCGQGETAQGYAGVVRPGEAAAARAELGSALLAQVSDNATGQVLDFTRVPGGTVHFSRWLPVYPQSRQPRLLSCNYLLADKPADRPIMDAAIGAAVQAGYFKSASSVRSQLQMVLVSDDPAARGSVIVTLMFTGPVHPVTAPKGVRVGPHPPLHGTISYTVLEQEAGAKVTGVARGGF
jgi:hypothetical protein